MDLSAYPNPYDFSNPVFEAGLFIGRNKEMEEIRYYLDHAKRAPRPINIAIIGPRASGKTSILNMTQLEAEKRDFCVARIDLDEGDTRGQLAFFHTLFDALISAACDAGAYGGRAERTYQTYLDMISTYSVPEENLWCPFLFPIQYARAMGSGHPDAVVSDSNFRADLRVIQQTVNRPIALMIDEGNVLASDRVYLEMLRNTFMNTPGYILIITGTPDLFPAMNEVFSPIIRQFKKISIDKFRSPSETAECVTRPLSRLGLRPEQVSEIHEGSDLVEIHDLSGGRPYEIQLICHMLFRRVQAKRASKMTLDLSILEEMRRELETTQDLASRPTLVAIRSLTRKQLQNLRLFCFYDGASFDQLWGITYVTSGNLFGAREELEGQLQELLERGIFEIKDEKIRFQGDQFDRIYTKYFARQQRVALVFPDWPPALIWHLMLDTVVNTIADLHTVARQTGGVLGPEFGAMAARLANPDDPDDVFAEAQPVVQDVYHLLVDHRLEASLRIVRVEVSLPLLRAESFHHFTDPARADAVQSALVRLRELAARAEEIGGAVLIEDQEIAVPSLDQLAEKVSRSSNELLRKRLAGDHAERATQEYGEGNSEEAQTHAALSYRYQPDPSDATTANNLGYVMMSTGEFEKAKRLLAKATFLHSQAENHRPDGRALSEYNLGIVEACQGNFGEAEARLDSCISLLQGTEEEDRQMMCLFVPRLEGTSLALSELKDGPDLLRTAQEARKVIESLAN